MKTKLMTVRLHRKGARITNYRKRLKLLMGKQPRVVVRKSVHFISAQLVEYKDSGDVVLAQAHSSELADFGYKASPKNLPAAYLTGMLLARRALKNRCKSGVLDSGLYPSIQGNRIYAALKGVVDGGFVVPHDAAVLPKADRLTGKHIVEYAKSVKGHAHMFKVHPGDDLPAQVEGAKKKIMELK